MHRKLLSFIIITWNSEKTIEETIKSIFYILDKNKIDAKEFEIFIVDNGSTDRTLSIIKKYEYIQEVKIISLNKNMGTTFSRNIALRQANGNYICIMDSDVVIKKWEIYKSLEYIEAHSSMLAPKLKFPDGRIQHSVKKFPSLSAKLLKLPKIFIGIDKYAYHDFYKDFPFENIREVETAISAFWIFPRKYLDTVGYFDENIFYSPEDIDYCLRIQKAGYLIYFYPEIEAIHYTQQISHKKPLSKLALSHFWGIMYYFIKHKYLFRPKFKNKKKITNAK